MGIAPVPEAVAARKASSSNASTSSPSTAAAATTSTNQQQASALVHTAIGAVAGVVEVSIMQPTVAIKNALQVTFEERERERARERESEREGQREEESKRRGMGQFRFFSRPPLADRASFFLPPKK